MNFPLFVAGRYLVSKRKKNFINIISLLSLAGVAFSTAALIIVLSIFNGLEDLLRSLNNAFDPEIKIEASRGKSFVVTDSLKAAIRQVEGVEFVTEVIEDYVYLRYRDANQVVTMKGVSEDFLEQHRIDDKIVAGKLRLKEGDVSYAIIGRGIQYNLSVAIDDNQFALQAYYINNVRPGTVDPSKLYSRKSIFAGAASPRPQAAIRPPIMLQSPLPSGNIPLKFDRKSQRDGACRGPPDKQKAAPPGRPLNWLYGARLARSPYRVHPRPVLRPPLRVL